MSLSSSPSSTTSRSSSSSSSASRHRSRRANKAATSLVDIEDLHDAALAQSSTSYIDPATGFTAFTALSHLDRGHCCGAYCRHCPYGWSNTPFSESVNGTITQPKTALVQSGDEAGIAKLKERLVQEAQERVQRKQALKAQQQSLSSATDNGPQGAHRAFSTDAKSTDPSAPSSNTTNNANDTAAQSTKAKTGGRHGGRLTDKNVPYTRTGDMGTSQLLTGERRSKYDDAFEAMGTVDELTSVIGLVYSQIQAEKIQVHSQDAASAAVDNVESWQTLQEWLLEIMSRLFDLGSHVAKPKKTSRANHQSQDNNNGDDSSVNSDDSSVGSSSESGVFVADGVGGGFDQVHIQQLEDYIDLMTETLPEIRSFLLPTGTIIASQLHQARCVARRAERCTVPLVQARVCDPRAMQYLNRLSDFLFTAARYANHLSHQDEILYRKPSKLSKQRIMVVDSRIVKAPDNETEKS
jgi:cob(I)alamin adenosyltransferase